MKHHTLALCEQRAPLSRSYDHERFLSNEAFKKTGVL
jgi:hypothetical protein